MRRFLVAIVLAGFACDSSAKVGEVRPVEEPPPEPEPVLETADPAAAGESRPEWRLQSPLVPCTIYALDELSADEIYAGCNGGLLYRFDGVHADLAFAAEDEQTVFSLIHHLSNGEVWAGAQGNIVPGTQLYRFDGKQWSKLGGAKERITSIAGHGSDVWITTKSEIRHYEDGKLVTSYTAAKGSFNACAFQSSEKGFCVGSQGLAVAWDGKTWSAVTGSLPWTSAAELFGVELDSISKAPYFVFGDPIESPNGDFACRAARLEANGTFTRTASTPCFATTKLPRKRTGTVSAGFDDLVLFSSSDSASTLVFDVDAKAVSTLCGPSLAFTRGQANARAGGYSGFLATVNPSGGKQLALTSVGGTDVRFQDLSVGADGAAWARAESQTTCAASSESLVRYEDGAWSRVPSPQGATSGRGLAALSFDRAYTVDSFRRTLLVHQGDEWVDGPAIASSWSLAAGAPDNIWFGGTSSDFGHFDGAAYSQVEAPEGGSRQVEQIVIAGNDTWMMQQGYSEDDTDQHLVRWADGKLSETNFGIMHADARMRLSALDETRVYASGSPAMRWDGTRWKDLSFSASGVWARAENEVYFTDGGDIWRWDGKKRTRVYHGVTGISHIAGSHDRAFAVGPGGLTILFQSWPTPEH